MKVTRYFYRNRYYTAKELYEIACREYGCDIYLQSFRLRLYRYSVDDAVKGKVIGKTRIIKTCELCGEEFEASRQKTRFCSLKCRDTYKSQNSRKGCYGNERWVDLKDNIEPITEIKQQSIRLICLAVIEDAKKDLEQNRNQKLKDDAITFFRYDLDDWLIPFNSCTKHFIRKEAERLLKKEEKPATRRRQAFKGGTLKVN